MLTPDSPATLRSLLGPRFWGASILAALAVTAVLSAMLIDLDIFEGFYDYTRKHESWELDDLAMVGLATLISTAVIGSMVVVVLVHRLLRNEAARQAAELRVLQAHQMVALGTMVAGTAHSINNHLTPVIALADLVRSELPEHSPHAQDLAQILAAARSAAEIVTRMKTFAKTNHSLKGSCEVARATQVAIELTRSVSPASAHLDIALAAAQARIGVSSTAWEIVVINLLNNAVDALEGAPGRIEIRLDLLPPPWRRPDGSAWEPWVCLQVRDSGKGMSPEEIQRAFEPFFTTKPVGRGTGLGLPESHGIVDAAGGRIDVASTPGRGTHITVWLPVEDAAPLSNA